MAIESLGPILYLVGLVVLIVVLVVIYMTVVNQSCICLRDPGGRGKARKERKKQEGYDEVSSDESGECSDDGMYSPPTMTPGSGDTLEEGTELVGPRTLSPYSAYSAYGDSFSITQSYIADHGLGRIRFDADYAADESRLQIHIIEGDCLPSKEQGGARNFKIHLALLPKKEQRFKSKSKSRYAPNFNESFVFENVAIEDLFTTSVRFRLYSGAGKLVGETFFQLADIAKLDNPVIQSTWRAFRAIQTK